MNKKTAILSGVLVMLGIVATVGIVASTESGMIKKGVNQMPEGRSEYTMTDEELKQLEQELKSEEGTTPEEVTTEENVTTEYKTPVVPLEEQSAPMMEEEEMIEEVTPTEMPAQ